VKINTNFIDWFGFPIFKKKITHARGTWNVSEIFVALKYSYSDFVKLIEKISTKIIFTSWEQFPIGFIRNGINSCAPDNYFGPTNFNTFKMRLKKRAPNSSPA